MAIFGRRRRQNGGSAADASRTPPPSAPVEEEAYALLPGDDAFPMHVFDFWGIDPIVHTDLIGGGIRVVEKRPTDGPITLMTSGASRLPTGSGERVELAVEVAEGQQGAGRIALGIVCDDMARHRRVPPLDSPWRNTNPFLDGTLISAIMATASRWGASFDEVRSDDGALRGHVRTLRLLTDAEAGFAAANGWAALVQAGGSVDAFLDVTRRDVVAAAGLPGNAPAFVTKLHADHPPRWVTFTGTALQSVTGLESEAYMDDAGNADVWSVDHYLARFPWVAAFVQGARAGDTALFVDDSGQYTLE